MEINPKEEYKEEEEVLKYAEKIVLPYLKEEKKELPKDYNATIERLSAQLEQTEGASMEGKALFGVGIVVSSILIFIQLMEQFNYPSWMEILHPAIIFGEALIPFAVSFFLKNAKHATLMRLVGIIVLLTYLFTLFF
jgi:hypothetical protein